MTTLPQAARNEVKAWKNKGGKVHLLLPEINPLPGKCSNCRGEGRLYIGFIVGGPYPAPESGYVRDSSGKDSKVKDVHFATSIEGQWYKRRISNFVCPVCNGSGIGHSRQERAVKPTPVFDRVTV